jgi:hypothetical protein
MFYIVVINHLSCGESNESNYHLEKLNSFEQAVECLTDDDNYENYREFFIVTNNDSLVKRYGHVLYLHEFKKISDPNDSYEEHGLFLRFGRHYVENIFENVEKLIQNNKLFSIHMNWSSIQHQPWDDFGPTEVMKEFDCWAYNQVFLFFKSPQHYKSNFDSFGLLRIPEFSNISLEKINSLFNTDILKIKNKLFPELSWSEENGYLKYFDKKSYLRLFVKKSHLQILEEYPFSILCFENLIDKNGYLEVYLKSLVSKSTGELLIQEKSHF